MAFWSAPGAEPLRQHRWYITFGGSTGLDRLTFALKKCDRPKAKIGSIQHKYLNHYYNYPGRLEWEDINMTFAAVADPKSGEILYNILTTAGYQLPTDGSVGELPRRTIGKDKFVSAIANNGFDIINIDPDGKETEKWTIKKPFFTSVQFGSLDYGAEEIVEITCTVKYDWAVLATTPAVPPAQTVSI